MSIGSHTPLLSADWLDFNSRWIEAFLGMLYTKFSPHSSIENRNMYVLIVVE